MSFRVRYIYSACVVIETDDLTILCDPWFSEGIYDGAWYHYPPLDDPSAVCGPADLIYISHIHPDHYDPDFLKQYLRRYPECEIIIAPFGRNFLSQKMHRDGIPHSIVEQRRTGATELLLVPHGPRHIDSALAVRYDGKAVVNMNDNALRLEQIQQIREFAPHISLALLPYAGAGPYPQIYSDDRSEVLGRAEAKRLDFHQRYRNMRDALEPDRSLPFAGKYILGGHLHPLNGLRGVGDAVDVARFDPNAVVLADGGQAWFDCDSLSASAIRETPYDPIAIADYAAGLADRPMAWELDYQDFDMTAVDFTDLLERAYKATLARASTMQDYWFAIQIGSRWFCLKANVKLPECYWTDDVSKLEPRCEIYLDQRYLHGILSRKYHWNNAEIGSQLRLRRYPDQYLAAAFGFLHFFHL